ncbi:hypothetical protein [Variovorax sp. tm]|uniref:hypothetical protein n=1 Tax=Variovorax atrisoli TaxID=3394203 RepID=UPI003A7F8CC6
MTNVEFIVELMERSAYGALIQAFVIHGLDRYAQRVIAAAPESLHTGLVSGHAWRGCALEVRWKLAQRLGEEGNSGDSSDSATGSALGN